jgi:hypothetical protein
VTEDLRDLCFCESVRLHAVAKTNGFDMNFATETRQDILCTGLAGGIAVEEEGDCATGPNGVDDALLLGIRQGAAHEGNGIRESGLPQAQAVEEPFDQDEAGAGMLFGSVQVEHRQFLPEIRREFVFAFALGWVIPWPAAGVGNELALLVVT